MPQGREHTAEISNQRAPSLEFFWVRGSLLGFFSSSFSLLFLLLSLFLRSFPPPPAPCRSAYSEEDFLPAPSCQALSDKHFLESVSQAAPTTCPPKPPSPSRPSPSPSHPGSCTCPATCPSYTHQKVFGVDASQEPFRQKSILLKSMRSYQTGL